MSHNASLQARLQKFLGSPRTGKVRDTYELPRVEPHAIALCVVSDRASIFDFKLGTLIPGKGEALNAFNIAARLYRRKMLPHERDDLALFGSGICNALPPELWDEELQRRATVVYVLEMVENRECVCRGYATGSLWKAYAAGKRMYCGHLLPEDLVEGERLPQPLFTPTTKATEGHDEELNHRTVRGINGIELEEVSLRDYKLFSAYSMSRLVIGVDSKAEYGRFINSDGSKSALVLADEWWTADSCRFWEKKEYEQNFPRKLPEPMDKQAIRNWGIRAGINKLDPKNPADKARAYEMEVPREVIEEYLGQIHKAFEMLYGMMLKRFQKEVLKIY